VAARSLAGAAVSRRRLCLIAALLCLLAARAEAAEPRTWRVEGPRDFLEGTFEGLSVDSEGRVRLAPTATSQGDLASAQAWCVARDAEGNVFVGTGSEGRVFRIKDGKATPFFAAPELEVHALAAGPDHRLYAATSPDGKVYAIDASGKAEIFFDPGDKYIWALAFDSAGRLLVATGLEGKLQRVDSKGKSEIILSSPDAHLTALATDRSGNVFAGSSPSGYVYRVDGAGKVSVLDDTPYREIKALAVAPDGALYVAGIDGKEKETASPSLAPLALPTTEVTVTESLTAIAPFAFPPATTASNPHASDTTRTGSSKGGLLRIAASGEVETLWSSTEDAPHSLLLDGAGVLLGTGDKGKLYRVRDDRSWSMTVSLPGDQVTGLASAGDKTIVALSNPARVYLLSPAGTGHGTFTAKVKDAEAVSTWGRVRWEATTPAGTEIKVQTRSGNTENPDATWSDWSPVYRDASGDPITNPGSRFLQVRAVLDGNAGKTPLLDSLSAVYLQRNLRPDVQSISVHPPGEVFQKPISLTGDAEILGLDPAPDSTQAQAQSQSAKQLLASAMSPFTRKLYQKGIQTFSWKADDPNGDALVYEVSYRSLGEKHFHTLRTGLSDAVLAWDTSTVPNGRYLIRVVARDTPGNPDSQALSAEKESEPFDVDNTPPTVVARLVPGSVDRVHAVATDQDSFIRKAEYCVDGGAWHQIHPKDGINDSREESYEFVPDGLSPGAHTVVIRATDLLGNLGSARVEIGKEHRSE